MRRAPDDARGSDGARGGVELIHASLSSAEKLDMARARARVPRPSSDRPCAASVPTPPRQSAHGWK